MHVPHRKSILGLGNLLYQDEGFGIHALQAMQAVMPFNEHVELVDGGVLGMNLLPLVEESSHLLVLDAIDAGLPPGTVIELSGEQIPLFAAAKLSEHQVGFQEVLGLARFRDSLPENLHLIGVQPQDLGTGIDLSQVVAASLPEVVTRAMAVLQKWHLLESPQPWTPSIMVSGVPAADKLCG
jgi:hydrogenase maturation protease